MANLDSKFAQLKEYSQGLELTQLNKRIYDSNLTENYLKKLNQNQLIYIHVKLHTALSYRKPFTEFPKIKKAHDLVTKYLDHHPIVDKLDAL